MGSPYIRLGIGISINGIAALFLGYALLGDGGDFYLNLSRTHLALTMVAPLAVMLLLAMTAMHRSLAASYVVLGAFAALLVAILALPPTPPLLGGESAVHRQGEMTPVKGMLARY